MSYTVHITLLQRNRIALSCGGVHRVGRSDCLQVGTSGQSQLAASISSKSNNDGLYAAKLLSRVRGLGRLL